LRSDSISLDVGSGWPSDAANREIHATASGDRSDDMP
jgi:hypothetical protein